MVPKIWLDDKSGVVRMVFSQKWGEEDVHGIFSQLRNLFAQRKDRLIIADLTSAPPQQYSKELRNLLAAEVNEYPIHKVAMLGANPALRMMAKFLLSALRSKIPMEAEFFKSDKDAICWLKNGSQTGLDENHS